MRDPYAIDAPYYDAIHSGHDEDIGLWLSFAGRTDRPVLEAGCGTGRITLPLAQAGHTVTGIDPSFAMLEIARRKGAAAGFDKIEWSEVAITDPGIAAGRYGFVLIPQDVFLYCGDGEEQIAWLRACAAAMQFNAVLAIDLPGPAQWLDPATNGQPVLAFTGERGDGVQFDAWHIHEDDLGSQTRWLRVVYETIHTGGVLHREQSEHNLRYLYRFEIEYLLAHAGLALQDVYGDYDLGPLTNDSERMIMIARRQVG